MQQLGLFQTRPQPPRWEALPPPNYALQRVIRLLVQLLRENVESCLQRSARGQEVGMR